MKGVPFVNERYKKGVLFLLKKSIGKGKGLDLGAEPPLIIIIIGIVTVANSFFFYSCYGPADCVGSSNK